MLCLGTTLYQGRLTCSYFYQELIPDTDKNNAPDEHFHHCPHVPGRMHSYCHTIISENLNRIVGIILLRTRWYHPLLFFRCGVYKYCCLVQFGAKTKYGVPTVRGQWHFQHDCSAPIFGIRWKIASSCGEIWVNFKVLVSNIKQYFQVPPLYTLTNISKYKVEFV